MSRQGFVYFIECGTSDRIKIGWALDPPKRLKQLQTGASTKLKLLAAFPGTVKDEKMLHWIYADRHWHGEWFRPDDRILARIKKAIDKHGPTPWDRSATKVLPQVQPVLSEPFDDERWRLQSLNMMLDAIEAGDVKFRWWEQRTEAYYMAQLENRRAGRQLVPLPPDERPIVPQSPISNGG